MTNRAAPAERNGTRKQAIVGRAGGATGSSGIHLRKRATKATAVVVRRRPAALAASRGTITRVLTVVDGSTSASLTLGTVFAAGLSGGMFLSRAPRVLVALAFVPALLFGGTLLGRGATRAAEPARRGRT